MNNFYLKSFECEALRSFRDPQVIKDLPDTGLILVSGRSGNGKSALFEGIAFCLKVANYPETELQSFLTDKRIQTSLGLSHNRDDVIIKRGREFSISVNNNKIEGSTKVVQAEIDKIFDIDFDLLNTICYKNQHVKSAFLIMTDTEKKGFLSKLLNLEQVEENLKKSTKKIAPLEKELFELTTRRDILTKNLHEPTKPIKIDNSINLQRIEELNCKLNDIKANISVVNKKLEALRSNYGPKEIKSLDILMIEGKLEEYLEDLGDLESHLKDRSTFVTEISNRIKDLQHEIDREKGYECQLKKVNENACPTCFQPWQGDAHITLKNTLTDLLIEIDNKKLIIEHHKADRDDAQKEVGSTEDYIKAVKTKIENTKIAIKNLEVKENEGRYVEFSAKLKELDGEKSLVGQPFFPISTEIYELKSKIEADEATFRAQTSEYNKHLIHYNECKRELDVLVKFCIDKQTTLNEEKDFIGLCKGFLSQIFDEVLTEIANETNDILKYITNVSDITVAFDTEKVNKDDTVRQEIKLNITKGTHQMTYRMLSGGQQTALALAIDLSLGKIISRRSGISVNWLILDEPFVGLNVEDVEHCLELLKTASSDKLIIIVDHNTESKQYFDKVIEIEYSNGISWIKNDNTRSV